MLLGKDHVGGEGSCWWERIMLVLQDDEERRNVVFVQTFAFHKPTARVSVRNINRSKLYVFAPRNFSN